MKHEPLYQVRVIETNENGKQTMRDVGPKLLKDAAESFRDAIMAQIRLGREKTWSDPIIYQVMT